VGIPEKVVEELIKEASLRMSDPTFAEQLVSSWISTQPHATQYLASKQAKLGGAEGVINAVFHAALIATCFRRHSGRFPPPISFETLNRVAELEQDKELQKRQPPIAAYLAVNVESVEARKALTLIALGIDELA
jgi:hypothetical protein